MEAGFLAVPVLIRDPTSGRCAQPLPKLAMLPQSVPTEGPRRSAQRGTALGFTAKHVRCLSGLVGKEGYASGLLGVSFLNYGILLLFQNSCQADSFPLEIKMRRCFFARGFFARCLPTRSRLPREINTNTLIHEGYQEHQGGN